MSDQEEPTQGMSRRDLLRRGAFVGGATAAAWVAPTVTTFGARAFAQEGSDGVIDGGDPGDISWLMVWFVCTDPVDSTQKYHLVKYEGTDSGYSQNCAATKSNVSGDGSEGASYFDVQQGKVAGLDRDTSCPPDVTVSSADGVLQLSASGSCQVVGWVMHDGSCGNVGTDDPYPKFRSVENSLKNPDDPSEGHVGPVASELPDGGPFQWQKCR